MGNNWGCRVHTFTNGKLLLVASSYPIVDESVKSHQWTTEGASGQLCQQDGVTLDESLHSDITTMMDEHTRFVHQKNKKGSFHCLFWDQQMQAARPSDYWQIRWHPQVSAFTSGIQWWVPFAAWVRSHSTSIGANALWLHSLHSTSDRFSGWSSQTAGKGGKTG